MAYFYFISLVPVHKSTGTGMGQTLSLGSAPVNRPTQWKRYKQNLCDYYVSYTRAVLGKV